MSLQIVQRPTSPNAAYTRLLYAISGSPQLTQPQFQYVMDVYESGSTNLIKRTRQTANPAETAIFDPSRIIQGELSDDYSWKISSLTPFNSSSKAFTIKFGVQYANSISSSVTVYPDILEDTIEVFRGVVEPNDGYYNWPSSSKAVLSNMPSTMSMQFDDYGTISVYNNSVQYVNQSFYSNNLKITEANYSVTNNFTSIPISSSIEWDYVDVEVSSSIGKQNYRYERSDDDCREKVRFAFINKQGTWDYYNNFNPVRQGIDITRQQYTAPRVDYSSITSTYDITRRGRTVNNSSTDDSFSVDTDWLTKTDANWLEELIESPSVYIQRNGEFIPIIINNSNYTSKTSVGRQKLFKYTLNFTPSNQPFGTWIPEYISMPAEEAQITASFDATLGGTLQPYLWYDFTDTGSLNMSGDDIRAITSKGFYTASLVRGKQATYGKYSDTNWQAPKYTVEYSPRGVNNIKYAYFNGTPVNPLNKQSSTLSIYYDYPGRNDYGYTGDGGEGGLSTALPGQKVYNTQQNWTYLVFYKPVKYYQNGGFASNQSTMITSFRGNDDQPNIFGDQPWVFDTLTNFNYSSSPTGSYDYYSSTISLISASTSGWLNQGNCGALIGPTSASSAAYSYDGAGDPGWVTSIGRQTRTGGGGPSGNSTFELMREPGETVLTFTGSGIANEVFCDAGILGSNNERLNIGSVSNRTNYNGGNFYISHYLFYTQSLSDTQINNLVNSYKSSSFQPVNAISN